MQMENECPVVALVDENEVEQMGGLRKNERELRLNDELIELRRELKMALIHQTRKNEENQKVLDFLKERHDAEIQRRSIQDKIFRSNIENELNETKHLLAKEIENHNKLKISTKQKKTESELMISELKTFYQAENEKLRLSSELKLNSLQLQLSNLQVEMEQDLKSKVQLEQKLSDEKALRMAAETVHQNLKNTINNQKIKIQDYEKKLKSINVKDTDVQFKFKESLTIIGRRGV